MSDVIIIIITIIVTITVFSPWTDTEKEEKTKTTKKKTRSHILMTVNRNRCFLQTMHISTCNMTTGINININSIRNNCHLCHHPAATLVVTLVGIFSVGFHPTEEEDRQRHRHHHQQQQPQQRKTATRGILQPKITAAIAMTTMTPVRCWGLVTVMAGVI